MFVFSHKMLTPSTMTNFKPFYTANFKKKTQIYCAFPDGLLKPSTSQSHVSLWASTDKVPSVVIYCFSVLLPVRCLWARLQFGSALMPQAVIKETEQSFFLNFLKLLWYFTNNANDQCWFYPLKTWALVSSHLISYGFWRRTSKI